ncbi:MAG: IS5 family transposase [Gammaproteobacteria bacterium]
MAKKQTYRIRNWPHYNKALTNRGSLTIWFDEESIKQWHNIDKSGARGRPKVYAEAAILCVLTLKMVFRLPLRALQGFTASLIELMALPIKTPNYTTVCRRQGDLEVPLKKFQSGKALHAVFDSTGLKVFGEGEWKVRQYGYSKRRTWRKLHLGIDEATGEIIAKGLSTNDVHDNEAFPDLLAQINSKILQASADGAYDSFENYELLEKKGAKVTIPPRETAKIKQHGNCKRKPLRRDKNIRAIRKIGKAAWKRENGYHRRSIAENAMFRFKKIFGNDLKAILFENQATEAFIKCNALNKMTS